MKPKVGFGSGEEKRRHPAIRRRDLTRRLGFVENHAVTIEVARHELVGRAPKVQVKLAVFEVAEVANDGVFISLQDRREICGASWRRSLRINRPGSNPRSGRGVRHGEPAFENGAPQARDDLVR